MAATPTGRYRDAKAPPHRSPRQGFKPRENARDVRDAALRGFGVRVLPSGGKRFFVHCQHDGERVWRIVGDADALNVADARARARGMLAAIRRGEKSGSTKTLFEDFAASVFERRAGVWKAGTLAVNRGISGTGSALL